MGELGISAAVARAPEHPAVVLGSTTRTYRELDDRSNGLAETLARSGVEAGGRVAIMLPNCLEFFDAWLAVAKLDAFVVLVNWHLKADEVAWILDDSGARVLVTTPELAAQVGGALDGREVLVTGDAFERAATSDAPAREATVLASPVFYTSGTSGRPKGVVHGTPASQRGGDAARGQQIAAGQAMLWSWTDADVYLLSGPAYHAGPGGFAMTALAVGATTVILPEWDAAAWLRVASEHGVTISFMVPAHFIRLLELPEAAWRDADLSALRIIVHGGAPCPVSVKARILDALAPGEVWELYGASEGGATRISPDEWRARPGSVGLPWPGTEVRILDPTGQPLPTGETGLVYIAPAGGARFHYHDDEAKTADAWRDDAFTVGDVGHVDADGYLYLTDRASDMVIRGGVNVYPREIEDVLFGHPAVVDCAVFGVPDERLGERLAAVVEVREPVEPEVLRDFCREHLADYKVPATVEIVDELPRHPNGKVLKRLLREQAWAGRDTKIG